MKYLLSVKNLIELLKEEDSDTLVYLSSDEEGNEYSPLSRVFGSAFVDKHDELIFEEEDEEDEALRKVLIFYP